MIAVTVDEALHLWNEALEKQHHKIESIPVGDAKGYVLAEDVLAPTDVPAFHKSANGWVCLSIMILIVIPISSMVSSALALYGISP